MPRLKFILLCKSEGMCSSPNMTFVLSSALWVLKVSPLLQVQSKGKFCRVFDLVPHILRPQDAPRHVRAEALSLCLKRKCYATPLSRLISAPPATLIYFCRLDVCASFKESGTYVNPLLQLERSGLTVIQRVKSLKWPEIHCRHTLRGHITGRNMSFFSGGIMRLIKSKVKEKQERFQLSSRCRDSS